MEKIKSNKRETALIFLILLIVTNTIFIPFLSGHMSTDSYNIFNKGYEEYATGNSFLDGRVFMGIFVEIIAYFDVPIIISNIISLEIAIILSCIAIMVLANTFQNFKKVEKLSSKIILYVASYYAIFNLLYIENLYYIEALVMALSILLYILSARILVKKTKMYLLKSFILVTLGIMSYQGTISLFFLAVLVFSMCEENTLKGIIITMIKAVIITLLGILINNLQIMFIENTYNIKQDRGITSYIIIYFNIRIILDNILNIIRYTGGYFPNWSYAIIVVIIELLIFIKLLKQNQKNPDKSNQKIMIEQIFIVICGILFSCMVSVISTSGLLSGRIRFAMGAIVGFIFLHLWAKTDFVENKKDIFNTILICILILYGIVNSVNYVCIMRESKQVEENDKQEVYKIQEEVKKYEEENNTEITKIAVVVEKGHTSKAFYPETYHRVFVTHSAIKTEWSIVGCYNYYTGENLEKYEPTEAEKNIYLEQEKDGYLCIDDVLYITAYMY